MSKAQLPTFVGSPSCASSHRGALGVGVVVAHP